MAKTDIPNNVKLALFGAAAGLCEYPGCATRLDVDDLTQRRLLSGCFAHVIADSPDGPRGDPVLSPKLAKDITNIMLMCLKHHRLIDYEGLHDHPVDLLLKHKAEHEARIRWLTDIQPTLRTKLLFVEGLIGQRPGLIQFQQALRAVLPLYPVDDGLHIDLSRSARKDDEPGFWASDADELVRLVERGLAPTMKENAHRNVSVFALAPIPLLMMLGRTLGDVRTVNVFQKRRVPDTWEWADPSEPHGHLSLLPPDLPTAGLDVALVLSVSGWIHDAEIEATLAGPRSATWRISADQPGLDFVKARDQLTSFSALVRNALTAIRERHGPSVLVHLLPALPNSFAVEVGRVLLPKADPKIRVYDRNSNAPGFTFALDLL